MLMLLSVHVNSFLFLVQFNNFHPDYGLLLELHDLTLVARSFALLTLHIQQKLSPNSYYVPHTSSKYAHSGHMCGHMYSHIVELNIKFVS